MVLFLVFQNWDLSTSSLNDWNFRGTRFFILKAHLYDIKNGFKAGKDSGRDQFLHSYVSLRNNFADHSAQYRSLVLVSKTICRGLELPKVPHELRPSAKEVSFCCLILQLTYT